MMRRRELLQAVSAALIGVGVVPRALAQAATPCNANTAGDADEQLRDYLDKIRQFNKVHPGDVLVEPDRYPLLQALVRRLERLQQTVGHGRFQLVDFDAAREAARQYPRIGEFTTAEVEFLEKIFYADATPYGFLDSKCLPHITDRIPTGEVVKIPGSGNYLYRGRPVEEYERIRRDLGVQAILTSGVRGVMKQFLLFLRKAGENTGNLSLASRSFAPPGYSFHGISDFDLGQVGYGADNFTERFVTSDVFRKLKDLDYIDLRYPKDNLLGVRFEPWHIKVAARA